MEGAARMMHLSSPWEQNESFLDPGFLKKCSVRHDESCQACILSLRRLRQEDCHESEASLGYAASSELVWVTK